MLGFVQLYIGLFFSVVGFAGTLNMILDFNAVRLVWGMFVFLDAIGAPLLFISIRNLQAVKSCRLFDEAFQRIGSRTITLEEISVRMGISPDVVLGRLQLLVKKQCLKNVSINLEDAKPVIVLENDTLERRGYITEYIVVNCPNCGSSCSVKRGSIANCEYCGGRITGN